MIHVKLASHLLPPLLCCFSALWLSGCATQILLHPDTARKAFAEHPVTPATYGDHPDIITVTNTFGNRLNGWLFSSPTNHGVVLVGDGNATGMAHTYSYNRFLLDQGFNVLILSYQGFDSNEGPADINSIAGDVEVFYQWCRTRFPSQRIALLAESISTVPFFACASRHPEISAIVLEALVNPKTVALAKANDWWLLYPIYPTTFCATLLISASVPNDLDLQAALRRHPLVPVLFIHHPKDRVTPYRTARSIYEQYDGPKEWISLTSQTTSPYHMIASFDPATTNRILQFLHSSLQPND